MNIKKLIYAMYSCLKTLQSYSDNNNKGGCISEDSLFLKSPKKRCENYPEHYQSKENAQDSDLAPLW